MNITNLNSLSFGASLVRQTGIERNFDTHTAARKVTTRDEFVASYDRGLKEITEKIQQQKQSAIELDDFMHSDEVKKIVADLPESGELEVAANFDIYCDNGEVVIDTPTLIYEQEDLPDDKYDKISSFFPQKEDGTIDKKGILNWLDKLKKATKQD